MRLLSVILSIVAAVALSACTTTETTRIVQDPEMTQQPAKIVDAKDIEEENGVTSKPIEPETPKGPVEPLPTATGPGKSDQPSATEPDDKAAMKQETEKPLFEPTRKAGQVDPKKVEALLEEMKKEECSKKEREEKMEEIVSQLRAASGPGNMSEEAQKKFDEAEKLYSQKKHKEAAAAYREVLDLVPTHKEALTRLRQCYIDMEEDGERAKALKKPASAQEMLALEQKFSSAIRLYDEGERDEAFAKFKEVVEMIEWSKTEIDKKNILGKAREYVERIKIEKELESKPPAEKEDKKEEKQAPQKKAPEQTEKPKQPEKPKKPEQAPKPGDISPY